MNKKVFASAHFAGLKHLTATAGFTLTELLIAGVMTGVMAAMIIGSLSGVMQANQEAESKTIRRVQLNRALDFMADEVRMATKIAPNAQADLTNAANFSTYGKTSVLSLTIQGVPQRVIYYIASKSAPWFGPKVIYRWGPWLDAKGNYKADTLQTPAKWEGRALVDLIEDSTPPVPSPTPVPSPSPTLGCTNGWLPNPSPPATKWQGFYACVAPNGRIAEIHLRGRLTDSQTQKTGVFEVAGQVTARNQSPPSP
jgi:type II secretory pathway pseudopilin PulG